MRLSTGLSKPILLRQLRPSCQPPKLTLLRLPARRADRWPTGQHLDSDQHHHPPFDVSAISPTDPIHGRGVFFQADIVVETDYTLQQFKGRVADSGAPTAVPVPPPNPLPPPNVFTPASLPPGVVGVNMGGCMGCHGNAQVTQAPILASSWLVHHRP